MSYNIILGVTGSIAAYKACEITSQLRKKGIEVTVVMTESAQRFVSPLSFRTLSQNRVYTNLFDEEVHDPHHVSLADKADLILIAPATASIIGRIASGVPEDLVSCIVIASNVPVVIAPAMDDNMYQHPAVQGNIKKLKGFGYRFVGPEEGPLASGRVGVGRLSPPEEIVRVVLEVLRQKEHPKERPVSHKIPHTPEVD